MTSAIPLSVVVPVCDAADTLDRTLNAILASALSREDYELIVVDDSSSDASPIIAARYADTVVRLTGRQSGPAYARNRGAELARGAVVAFVDADITVRPETLGGMLQLLGTHAGLDAIAASRDQSSAADNFASQYWNLLVHYGEQRDISGGSFTSGCVAVRRSALFSAGLYDEWRFATACLESVELGKRLERAGHGVLLSRELQVTQQKRWSFLSVCREVWHRSVLLTRSLGYHRTRDLAPTEVVFTLSRAAVPAFGVVSVVVLCSAFFSEPAWLIAIAIALAGSIVANSSLFLFLARARGWAFVIAAAPVHIVMQCLGGIALCVGRLMRDTVGDRLPDAATQAYAEVGLETWPPVRRPQ
ncbi:MAG TPA: glycosyltransferase family 2 protein [Gemmatimonadaceae bacterium]|nr:glycosyltransferase family 2 protein [Gemmatimonadaceae bacterium]